MRTGKNTFTIFAVLLIALVLFCVTRSEGFATRRHRSYDGFAAAPKPAPKRVRPMTMGQTGT